MTQKLPSPPTLNGVPLGAGTGHPIHVHAYPRIHINVPRYDRVWISWCECPTCKKRRPSVNRSQEWYGVTSTCLGCGDAWGDGERMPRPFMRGWRKKAIEDVRKFWKRWKKSNPTSPDTLSPDEESGIDSDQSVATE